MPLIHSASEGAFKKNIAQLIRDGYPRKQAVAIAWDIRRKAQKKDRKRK